MKVLPGAGWLPFVLVLGAWLAIAASVAIGLAFDYRLSQVGRGDLAQFDEEGMIFVPPVLTAAVVGSALAFRHPRHPVGWLFLGLAIAIAGSAPIDSYAAYGADARPGSWPASGFVATLADNSFIPWLMILAFILLLTPSGHLTSRVARLAAWTVLAGGIIAFAVSTFEPYDGEYGEEGQVQNSLEIEGAGAALALVSTTAMVALHVGLLAGPILLIRQFLSATGRDRTQLRWVAFAAIPFPVFVVGAYIAAVKGNDLVLGLMAGGFVAVVPLAAALAIERDHLYDVDRLLSRGLTYSLLTAGLVGCYAVVVLFVSQALGDFGGDSQIPAVVATLVTVSAALPARRYLQDTIDRRFNRRQYEATAAIRAFVREPPEGVTVEDALRTALGDGELAVEYWIDEKQQWVDEQGVPAVLVADGIAVNRRGATIARVRFDPGRTEGRIVEAASAEAMPEIENARLRAAIALQLLEVRESRSRIVEAQIAERRRIERNLHDGAQQRLLAIALQLRAAEVASGSEDVNETLDAAVDQLQLAVSELRDLANGLRPPVLSDGGLAAALDDLAARTPVPVRVDSTAERFAPAVEETAWFIACEAVANAVKHSSAAMIDISAHRSAAHLELRVVDDGCGGANPLGNGLRGIADRAEAAGGRLRVEERPGGGTVVAVELPCAS